MLARRAGVAALLEVAGGVEAAE